MPFILSRNLTLTESNQNTSSGDSTPPRSASSSRSSFTPWEGSSIFVEQGHHWSSAFIWLTALLLGSGFLFAFLAKIDQTISVRGELQPAASVNDVQSPSTGVVKDIFVSEGDRVVKGTPLLTVEASALFSQAKSLTDAIALLELESDSLKALENGDGAKSFSSNIDVNVCFISLK